MLGNPIKLPRLIVFHQTHQGASRGIPDRSPQSTRCIGQGTVITRRIRGCEQQLGIRAVLFQTLLQWIAESDVQQVVWSLNRSRTPAFGNRRRREQGFQHRLRLNLCACPNRHHGVKPYLRLGLGLGLGVAQVLPISTRSCCVARALRIHLRTQLREEWRVHLSNAGSKV